MRKVELTHANVSHQSDSVAKAWDLTHNCSLLNALPLNSTYGVCSALAAPLAVGGRVVMLSQFDTTNVWALLLGIGVNDEDKPWPKVNLFPSTPWQYRPLLEKYADAFSSPKEKEFVKYKLKKRMRAFVSSLEPLST